MERLYFEKMRGIRSEKQKIVLKDAMEEAGKFNEIKVKLRDRLGLDDLEVTEEMKNRLKFSKLAIKCGYNQNTYLELDDDFTRPFEHQYYEFTKKLQKKKLPYRLHTLKYLSTAQPDLRVKSSENAIEDMIALEKEKREPIFMHIQKESKKELLHQENLLIYVKVYQHNYPYKKGMRNPPRSKLSHGVVLHGQNTLADFRDTIICEADYCLSGVPPLPNQINKERFTAGMFYINNTFYIDKRLPENEDYSIPLKNWGKFKGMELGKTFPMEYTLISDLTVKMDYPYLYQHLGFCEHYIIVDQIRFLNTNESYTVKDFPRYYSMGKFSKKPCQMCHEGTVEKIVLESKRAMKEVTTVCNTCLQQFFYIDGEPIEKDIVVLSYVDRTWL